jgi:hypothetical protein
VPDPETQDPATLAGDIAGLYMAVKEGLLSIPERAGRAPGFVIWNWTFGFETDQRHVVSGIGALVVGHFRPAGHIKKP